MGWTTPLKQGAHLHVQRSRVSQGGQLFSLRAEEPEASNNSVMKEFKDIGDAEKTKAEPRALNPFYKKPIFKPV